MKGADVTMKNKDTWMKMIITQTKQKKKEKFPAVQLPEVLEHLFGLARLGFGLGHYSVTGAVALASRRTLPSGRRTVAGHVGRCLICRRRRAQNR